VNTIDDPLGALAGIPALPGARCVGRSDIFDQYDCPASVELATSICDSCPALTACERWLDGLRPAQRPVGVVGGRVNRPPQPRKRAS
jgi:hypothetical protein